MSRGIVSCDVGRGLQTVALVLLFATAAHAAEIPATAPEASVELPALEVSVANEATRPWRYLSAPGVEVLSRCQDATTRDVLLSLHRLDNVLRTLLPLEFQVSMAAPKTLIFSDQASTPSSAQDLLTGHPSEERGGPKAPAPPKIRFLPNLMLDDMDAIAVYAIIDEDHFNPEMLSLAPDHVQILLQHRTPPLPLWFKRAISRLFSAARFEGEELVVSPANWTTVDDAARIRSDPGYPRALLPIEDLFADDERLAVESSTEEQSLRSVQAALFVRWALEEKSESTRDGLWNFVRRTSGGVPSETLFRECLGIGYAEMRDRLSDYLPGALTRSFRLRAGKLDTWPALKPRPATDDEIGRLKGDWERLELTYVRARYPAFAPKYAQQAQRTFTRAYGNGARDPRFLAIYGLFACEVGDALKGREYLEAACNAKVSRPRAYFELARLRAAEATKKPSGARGLLSSEQVNAILQPLVLGSTQAPALAGNYVLTTQVWIQSNPRLTREQLALIDDGLHSFPTNDNLLYNAVVLKSLNGAKEEAETLLSRGERSGLTPAVRARFHTLRQALQNPQASGAEKPEAANNPPARREFDPKVEKDAAPTPSPW